VLSGHVCALEIFGWPAGPRGHEAGGFDQQSAELTPDRRAIAKKRVKAGLRAMARPRQLWPGTPWEACRALSAPLACRLPPLDPAHRSHCRAMGWPSCWRPPPPPYRQRKLASSAKRWCCLQASIGPYSQLGPLWCRQAAAGQPPTGHDFSDDGVDSRPAPLPRSFPSARELRCQRRVSCRRPMPPAARIAGRGHDHPCAEGDGTRVPGAKWRSWTP
jgi:hypothetical protein